MDKCADFFREIGIPDFTWNTAGHQWHQRLGADHLGAKERQFHGLIVTDLIQAIRTGDDTRVSRKETIYVFPYFATPGLQGSGDTGGNVI